MPSKLTKAIMASKSIKVPKAAKIKKFTKASKLKKIALTRVGQTKSTGNFAKIAKSAAKRYGSKEIGQKVAGKIYWSKVKRLSGGGKWKM